MNQDPYSIDSIRKASEQFLNIILSEVVSIGEIPAPTFSESQRAEYLANRFCEAGLQDCFMDEKGNVMATIAGTGAANNIIVTTHLDTINFNENYHISVTKDHLIGTFLGNSSVALAALSTLPLFLEKLNIKLKSNIILLASPMSLGRGNNEGIKHYLSNNKTPFKAGVTLENITLGRLNYRSTGMLTGEITCIIPEDFQWERYGPIGTIIPMSEIVNKIGNIALPKIPFSTIILGSINGGFSYNNITKKTKLCFEVRSESFEILNSVHTQIKNITEEISARSGMKVFLEIISQREPGGIDISHEIVQQVRTVFNSLGIIPDFFPTVSQLSVFKDFGIPCITLGITTKDNSIKLEETEEALNINMIPLGFSQLVASLIAIDKALDKDIPAKEQQA